MKKGRCELWVLWVVVTLAALLHLTRAIAGWDLNVGLWQVPIWFSSIVAVGVGYLSYRLFMHLR